MFLGVMFYDTVNLHTTRIFTKFAHPKSQKSG